MSSLKDFKDLVNEIDDPKLLDAADGLLKDLAMIQNLKEKIEMIENTLTEGDRATFWYFATSLKPEQVSAAANTVTGRRRIIDESVSREIEKKEGSKLRMADGAKASSEK